MFCVVFKLVVSRNCIVFEHNHYLYTHSRPVDFIGAKLSYKQYLENPSLLPLIDSCSINLCHLYFTIFPLLAISLKQGAFQNRLTITNVKLPPNWVFKMFNIKPHL